jgi:hypothetical protein
MKPKKLERKLRKQAKRLLRWAHKNGIHERVDVYINPDSGFAHAFVSNGEATVFEYLDGGNKQ